MDIIDRAQANHEKWEEQRLQALLTRNQRPMQQGTSLCVDCGTEIPEARRLAMPSACRCLSCQSAFEGGR